MHYSERIAPEAEVTRAAVAARTSYLRRALVPGEGHLMRPRLACRAWAS
jgi:hypothetical protein